jgi:hypothetical protein
MKKHILLLTLTLIGAPLLAGPYCIDNSEHLAKSGDNKEWHSVACDCSCEIIKNGYCTECGHLQYARTYEIVKPTQSSRIAQSTLHTPDNPQDVLKKLAAHYLKNR